MNLCQLNIASIPIVFTFITNENHCPNMQLFEMIHSFFPSQKTILVKMAKLVSHESISIDNIIKENEPQTNLKVN